MLSKSKSKSLTYVRSSMGNKKNLTVKLSALHPTMFGESLSSGFTCTYASKQLSTYVHFYKFWMDSRGVSY